MVRWLGSRVLGAAGRLEAALASSRPPQWPPLFVIGPPRSGTTLTGQVVTHALDVSYIPSRAVQVCTGLPHPPLVTATRLARRAGSGERDGSFTSHGGRGVAALSSSDSDFVWRFVLPDGLLGRGALSPRLARRIRGIVGGIERLAGRPFVDKSVGHSLRVGVLSELFEGALFVRTRRNPLAVAQSVYLARLVAGGGGMKDPADAPTGPDAWPTPHVRGWDELSRRPIMEQAVRQQALFDRDIDDGARSLPPGRMLEIDYDALCRDPSGTVDRVAAFMSAGGAPTDRIRPLPASFRRSNRRRVDPDTYERLRAMVDEVYGGRCEPLEPEDGEAP